MEPLAIGHAEYSGAGVTLAADVAGDPEAPTVIFLHGGGQTRGSWGKALTEISQAGFYAISLDLRGHGDSGWPVEVDYALDYMVADLRAVLKELDRPAYLVGASLGGLISLIYAGEEGTYVRGVILVDVAPRIEFKGASKIGEFMRSGIEGFASLDEAADAVAAYLPHRPRPKDTSGLMKNLRLRDDGRLHWHWDPRYVNRKMTEEDFAAGSERLCAAARKLSVPALLIRGGLSEVVSRESVDEFRALVPHAEFVNVEGADHMVAGDENDRFNDAVIGFLTRHRDQ